MKDYVSDFDDEKTQAHEVENVGLDRNRYPLPYHENSYLSSKNGISSIGPVCNVN